MYDSAHALPVIKHPHSLWLDPDSNVSHGVLLSDRIQFYAERIPLITPFRESNVGPASYDLTLGSECWHTDNLKNTGRAKRELSQGEILVVPPNSIVFVSSAETLTMPFYLVGRFNLKLRFLHEGLLVGAGPQIDPGFIGRLSCPLHNISSEKVSLKVGESFAVVEFLKTTPFASGESLPPDLRLSELRERGESRSLRGIDGHPCLTFPVRSLDREPIKRYLQGKLVTSSVEELAIKTGALATKVDEEVKEFRGQLRSVNLLAYLTVAIVAITLGTYFWAVVNWNKSVNEGIVRVEEQIKAGQVERAALQEKIRDLELRLNGSAPKK